MQLKHLTTEWHQFFLPLLVLVQGQAQFLVQVQALEEALKPGLELKKESANRRAQAFFFFYKKLDIFLQKELHFICSSSYKLSDRYLWYQSS